MTDRLLHEWFRQGLRANPDGPALRVGGTDLSYTELDRRARAWAAALTAGGRRPRRVGILTDKSQETYVGLLAALHAGAAVVPLGLDAPAERNADIAAAADVDTLIVNSSGARQVEAVCATARIPAVLAPAAPERVPAQLLLPAPREQDAAAFSPPAPPDPDDLAYILFTSGSTGRPKGVPITHRNIGAFLAVSLPRYDVGPGDRFSQVYELTFDLAMFDLFMAWGSGACVCALSRLQALDPQRAVQTLGLTVWHSTPSLVGAVMARDGLRPESLPGLRYAVFCGEPLPARTARYFRAAAPGAALDNIYGPTELTVACTAYRWPPGAPLPWNGATVPIGDPNDGMDHVLLDPEGRPAPDTGELCMTGPQMFGGYLDPANNSGRFVELDGRLWYRTGDRVRRDEKAGLVHLGRDDSQVKIQGYRVETAEVEHALRAAGPGVQAAVLAIAGETGTVLVAFVAGPDLDPDALTGGLAARLPSYMLPRHLWTLPEMPLNRNGKADRAALRAEAARRIARTAPARRDADA